jgi:hypothetical protein
MVKKLCTVFCILILLLAKSIAQQPIIDTLPFVYNNGLLIIKGTINGIAANFAFDTGATLGVANDNTVNTNQLKNIHTKLKIRDSNESLQKTKMVKADSLQIGNLICNDVQSVVFNMPYLFCNNLYLLGQNVIKKANWKFNFTTQQVYISPTVFAVDSSAVLWPVNNINHPHINYSFKGISLKNMLVDMGYSGFIEINKKDAAKIFANTPLQYTDSFLTTGMGLFGWGKPLKETTISQDSFIVANTLLPTLEMNITENGSTKLGIQFFTNFCTELILNNQANVYYVVYKKMQRLL